MVLPSYGRKYCVRDYRTGSGSDCAQWRLIFFSFSRWDFGGSSCLAVIKLTSDFLNFKELVIPKIAPNASNSSCHVVEFYIFLCGERGRLTLRTSFSPNCSETSLSEATSKLPFSLILRNCSWFSEQDKSKTEQNPATGFFS